MDAAAILAAQKFCDVWKSAFTGALESLGAASLHASWSAPLAESVAPVTPESTAVASWFEARGSVSGSATWLCEKSVAVQFAQLLQSEPCDPTAKFSEMNRDAFAEFLRQVAGQVSTDWKTETDRELELFLDSAEHPEISPALAATLKITSDKFPELTLQLFLNDALCAALAAPAPEKAEPVADTERVDPLANGFVEGSFPNLGLLLDVELEATIRFGQREMLLREVFGLMPGAVIELNQLVNEPAELLVAGRLIARGEVVVVDGNFGLRVTEVAVAAQRAALLEL
jgi:flagellar motor switch protein FliN/FliY